MTVDEFRKDKEYANCLEKIKSYPKGFEFTLTWETIPKAKANALKILMQDCIKMGLLDSVSFTLNLKGDITSDTYKKI